MAAGIGLLALFDRRQRAGLAQIFLISVLIGFTVLVPIKLLGFLDSFAESMEAAFVETTAHHSSFADRYLGWEALLGEWWAKGNILTYVLGQPFGSGYYRKIAEFGASHSAEYTPHNFYVQTLLRTGVAGLTLFLSLVMATGMGIYHTLSKIKGNAGPEFGVRLFLLVSLLMEIVFFLAYGARLEQGLLFGLAMAAATAKARAPDRGKFYPKGVASCRP
jgi:O-antigen ligase